MNCIRVFTVYYLKNLALSALMLGLPFVAIFTWLTANDAVKGATFPLFGEIVMVMLIATASIILFVRVAHHLADRRNINIFNEFLGDFRGAPDIGRGLGELLLAMFIPVWPRPVYAYFFVVILFFPIVQTMIKMIKDKKEIAKH
jgi:hypothetical protein